MNESEAYQVMEPLAIAFNFNDQNFAQWMQWMQELPDPAVAHRTAALVCREARDSFVPGFGVFKDQYNRFAERQRQENEERQLALESGELSRTRIPSYAEGVEIAWEAYKGECYRQKREPNREFFDSILSPPDRQARRERRGRRARS